MSLYVYALCTGVNGVPKRASGSLELGLQVWAALWVVDTVPKFSRRAVSARNC